MLQCPLFSPFVTQSVFAITFIPWGMYDNDEIGRLSNYAPVPVLSLAVPVLSLVVPVLSLDVPVLSLAVPVLSLAAPLLSLC